MKLKDWVGCLTIIFVVLLSIYWLGSKIYDKYLNAEKRPFWQGTELVQVCKRPYYDSQGCYKLEVTLLENSQARINFNNGGYIIVGDLSCYFAANFYGDTPRFTFCESFDSEDNQWDFLPAWVNY